VTEQVVDEFMASRPLEWVGNPKVPRADLVVPVSAKTAAAGEGGDGKMSKSQLKKLEKEKQIAAKKAQKAQEKSDKTGASTETPATEDPSAA
jgi:tryptophanyl-tRNA synthetase